MVKNFYHLLAGSHFLDVSVQFSKVSLLAVIVETAFFRAVPDIEEHGRVSQDHQKRKPPVQHKEKSEGTRDLDEALDDHGEAVVHGVGYGVHVIGKKTHQIAFSL